MIKFPDNAQVIDINEAPPELTMEFISNVINEMGIRMINTVITEEGETQESHLQLYEEMRDRVTGIAEKLDATLDTLPKETPLGEVLLAVLQLGVVAMQKYCGMVAKFNEEKAVKANMEGVPAEFGDAESLTSGIMGGVLMKGRGKHDNH